MRDAGRRVLACIRNNLAAFPPSGAFPNGETDTGTACIAWLSRVDLAADDVVQSGWVFSRDDSAVVMIAPGQRPSADDFRARLVYFSEAQGATVTSADPSVVGKDGFEPAYALSLFLSDGWRVSIEPALERPRSEDKVADWEVFTPQGVLLAGPGLKIDWQPGSENQEGRGGAIDFDAAARV